MFGLSFIHRKSRVLFPRFFVFTCLFSIGIGSLVSQVFSEEQSSYPSRPVKVVVPFAAGGGSDVLARILLSGVERSAVSREPLVVLNVGGAGGTIGSRRVKNAEPDGYEILALHDGVFTARQFGKVGYGYEAFAPIAATGRDGVVVAVRNDSSFANLEVLLETIRDKPESVVFGANLGAPSQLTGLLIEKGLDGAKFRYSQTGGGADRLASLLGDHVDVSSFSIAEYLRFKEAGVRALAYLGKDRHPALPETSTALEQGFDVVSDLTHFWWAPKGTPPERVSTLARILKKGIETSYVQEKFTELHREPVFLAGDELNTFLANRERLFSGVGQGAKVPQPPVIAWVGGGVFLLGLLVFFNRRRNESLVVRSSFPFPSKRLFGVCLLVVTYLLSMQTGVLGYTPATFLFVTSMGVGLSGLRNRVLVAWSIAALVLAFGGEALFSNFLGVDLP